MTEKPATTWGDMAVERDCLIDAILAVTDWKNAMEAYNNTAYKGDALIKVDKARGDLEGKMFLANKIIEKYRR